MDDLLVPFYRQYLQQVQPSNLRVPPAKLLVSLWAQDQLYRYCFDADRDSYLPPPQYQRLVLKRLIDEIERELGRGGYDEDEYAVSDELMSHMGILSAVPWQSDFESAQSPRMLSYYLPSNILDLYKPSIDSGAEINYKQRILIKESPNLLAAGSNVGLRTWEASLELAYYLCTCPLSKARHKRETAIRGANIIELGAGTGLLSLICALSLGADHVVATDGLTHVVDGIQTNIALNNDMTGIQNPKPPVAAVLDWTNPSNLAEILMVDGQTPRYDYVFGADITYHPELFDPLAQVIKLLKEMFPAIRVLISATIRNEKSLQVFRTACQEKHGLLVTDIEVAEWRCPAFKDQTGLFHEQAFPITIMDIA